MGDTMKVKLKLIIPVFMSIITLIGSIYMGSNYMMVYLLLFLITLSLIMLNFSEIVGKDKHKVNAIVVQIQLVIATFLSFFILGDYKYNWILIVISVGLLLTSLYILSIMDISTEDLIEDSPISEMNIHDQLTLGKIILSNIWIIISIAIFF